MFSRPLVPALCATIIGILIGYTLLASLNLPVFVFPLVILLFLGMTFFLPSKVRTVWLMAIFLLIGINSQVNRHTLPGLPQTLSEGERVVVEGTVYSPPRIRVNAASLYLHAEKIFLSQEVRSVKINIHVKIYRYRGKLKVGQRIRFPAKLREFRNLNNPGGFDYRFYMQSRGLSFMATVSDGRYVVPMGEGNLGFKVKFETIHSPLPIHFLHHSDFGEPARCRLSTLASVCIYTFNSCRLSKACSLASWSGRRYSNPRRPAWKAGSLPTELFPLNLKFCGKIFAKASCNVSQ